MTMPEITLPTEWKPERKIVGAAIATLILWIAQIIFPDLDIPVGVEGSTAVLAGYLTPNR